MAFNPSNAADCAVEVFGGWVTEMAPINVPLGVSPDCPECAFSPGSVFTRAAFEKVFNPPLASNTTITYGKSFVAPDKTIYNLYLASNGTLYLENLTNSPGTATSLFSSFPGLYARSATAFGREFIAISDGSHGADIPLQFDGINLDRVTQDGPGAPPTVSSVALPSSQMVSSGNTLTRQNNTVTCETATPNGLKVGYQAQISNVPDSNATSVVQTNNSSNQVVSGGDSIWELDSGQWRSKFNPGTSPLSAFIAQGFGFTIPSTATILGVIVNFGVNSQAATTGTVNQLALWYSGSQQGTAKSPATSITTTVTRTPYGSAGDLWGASLTPAIVNDPSFGFAISCMCDSIRVFLNFPFTIQVYYTLSGSGTVAQIASITINNETNPGQALVTTTEPHGLIPNIDVSIVGVEPGTVADVSSAQWSAGMTTLETAQNHNLIPGSVIQVNGMTTQTTGTTFSFNGTFEVLQVPSPNQIIYAQVPITATDPDVIDATASTGAVTIAWPIPQDTPTPTYFEVQSCPTPTTFYIQISYSDATWTTGTVGFIWEGIFYVTAILSDTEFQYQQYGPNGATTAVGTVTPFGQAAPGIHQVRQSFLTRQGFLTKPSPWVQFIANGGQYLQVDELAIGPDNIVARVLEFTGALGSQFYYIPTIPQVNGIIVGTSTQINDNTTTSILLDFADNTLFTGLSTSVPGNNTPEQITIDGALGFGSFDNYNVTWGQRNKVNGFLNMGFAGGYQPSNVDLPTGWSCALGAGNGYQLVSVRDGVETALQCGPAVSNLLFSQSAYQDVNGAPILTQNTNYRLRVWLANLNGGSGITFTVSFTSASTGFSSTATISLPSVAGSAFYEQDFSVITPTPIPEDMQLNLIFNVPAGQLLQANNVLTMFADTPYTDNILNVSYEDNAEAFDGITGETGPSTDPNQVMDFATISDIPYILTKDPSGRLHEITNTSTSLPSGWEVNERAANCGVLSAFALTKSQADDNSSSGGEEWFAWSSESGARIFGGNQVWKISQEIQPNWNDGDEEQSPAEINMAAQLTAWTLNDPVGRVVYFGLPLGTATAPNAIYSMNYRELDSAESIAFSPPYRTGFSGKLIATDNTRKWSPWYRPMNGAARMYRSTSDLTPVFFGGNGSYPIGSQGFGNVYVLNPNQYTDDDYGQFNSYYVTCALPTRDQEQGLQLGAGRKLLAYLSGYIQSISNVVITAFPANLQNPWPLTCTRTPGQNPNFDLEWTAGNLEAYRTFFKIQPTPTTGTDNNFSLQRFIPWFRKSRIGVRGAAQ